MNYTFLIQPTKGSTGSNRQDHPYKFILFPGSSRVSIPEEDYQRLMRLNSVQTFLNLELSDKVRPNFKGGYVKLGSRIYPLIIVVTQKDGAFRIPFGPGKEGLEEMKRTFREIQMAFKRFENRRLARLQNESLKRLGADEPPKEEVELFEKEIKDIGSKEGWSPRPKEAAQDDNKVEKSMDMAASQKFEASNLNPVRSRDDQDRCSVRAPQNKKPQARKSTTGPSRPQKKTSSLVKAMIVGSAISIATISLLAATDARAAENMDKTPDATITEAQGAESVVNLNIRIESIAPVRAASSAGCTLGFGITSGSEPSGLGSGFQGLQMRIDTKDDV